jgi:hypothetical protein
MTYKLKTLWQKLGLGNQKHIQYGNMFDKLIINKHKNIHVCANQNNDYGAPG